MRMMFSLCAFVLLSGAAAADLVTFTIDPDQSFFTIEVWSGDGAEQYSSPQTPGSDTTSLYGTYDVILTPDSLQFQESFDVQFAMQAVPQAPLLDGTMGTAPVQFGLNLSVAGIGEGVAAGRDHVARVNSDPIPRTGNTFDSTLVWIGLASETTSYNLTVLGMPVSGNTTGAGYGPNELSGGTLELVGDTYTMVMPYVVYTNITVSGIPIRAVYSGIVVGTYTVPEPSTWLLLGVGLLAFLGRKRQRKK